jgi:hypothetical protein
MIDPSNYWQYYGYPTPPQAATPQQPAANTASTSFLNISHPSFIKGMLAGAAVAYLLSNEQAQQAVIKTSVKLWNAGQGHMEEIKERFRDAEAELAAQHDE